MATNPSYPSQAVRQDNYASQQQPFLGQQAGYQPQGGYPQQQGAGYHPQGGYPQQQGTGHPQQQQGGIHYAQPQQSNAYKPLHLSPNTPGSEDGFMKLQKAEKDDAHLKARIRRLRFVSRIIALLIAIATMVPLGMTLHKFNQTKDVYRDAPKDGEIVSRTAWHADSRLWPTWMYFLVAAIAVVLNLAILLSYCLCGVKHANRTAMVTNVFTWLTLIGNLIVWIVAATIYRTEKDKNGVSDDLWGWACAPAARAIQREFAQEVNFDQYCKLQTSSWYTGIVQAVAALLTLFIYCLVVLRNRSKDRVKRQSMALGLPVKK